ncbi:MAG: hypothetical protein ACRC2H_09445 [Silanimonas sp.]
MQERRALVAIASFDTISEASVVQALLEADGIRVHASNSGLVGLDWSFSQAVGGVRLMVPGEHAARAQALVEDYRRGALAAVDDTGTPPPGERCPRCGSVRVRAVGASREKGLLVVMTVLFGAMFPTSATARRCDDCGNRWPAERNAGDAAH